MSAQRLRRSAVLLITPLIHACGDSSGPGRPTQLQPSPLPQTAAVGTVLAPSVTVLGAAGQAMPNIAVSFQVTGGGGSVSGTSATTDASGRAAAGTWTLGSQPGTNTLVATASGLNATFTVQTSPGAAASLEPLPGVPTAVLVGEALAVPPGVRVRDAFGNAVTGVQVLFGASTGTLVGATQTTDDNGAASVTSWEIGTIAGPQTWNVQAGVATRVFPIQVLPAAPATLAVVAGNAQRAPINREVPVAPAVALRDAYGNAIANAPVTFSVAQGGGTVIGGSATTDEQGIARVQSWRLGNVRDNVLVASSPGVPDALFDAVAEFMMKVAGDGSTCPIDTTGCSFGVRVFDAQGDPAGGQTVTWLDSSGASATTTTNMHGYATSTLLTPASALGLSTQMARLEGVGEEQTFSYVVVPGGGFHIDLRFVGDVPASVTAAFEQARLRWQQVITGNLPDIPNFNIPAGNCLVDHPAVNEPVDDLIIFVEMRATPPSNLGASALCWIRTLGKLPILGGIYINSNVLDWLISNDHLFSLALHEIGHVLGIGQLWHPLDFPFIEGYGGGDPRYVAPRAVSRFVLGGGYLFDHVPVENAGGEGTRDVHWRTSVLQHELMTGFATVGGLNPLSLTTIGALQDLGYQVNFGAADPYSLPGSPLEFYLQGGHRVEYNEPPMPRPRRW